MNVDRELRSALDVDPSPEFLARVRTRIANEPAPSRWSFAWRLVPALASAVAVLVVVVWWNAGRSRPSENQYLAATALPSIVVPNIAQGLADVARPFQGREDRDDRGPEPPSPRLRRSTEASREGGRAALQREAPVSEPAILIDAREAAVLRRFIAGVRSGEIDLRPLAKENPFVAAEPTPVDPIRIEPISIAPLAPGAEGVYP